MAYRRSGEEYLKSPHKLREDIDYLMENIDKLRKENFLFRNYDLQSYFRKLTEEISCLRKEFVDLKEEIDCMSK